MADCDEDDCTNEAAAHCPGCAVILCTDHCGGAGSDCPDCSTKMEAL